MKEEKSHTKTKQHTLFLEAELRKMNNHIEEMQETLTTYKTRQEQHEVTEEKFNKSVKIGQKLKSHLDRQNELLQEKEDKIKQLMGQLETKQRQIESISYDEQLKEKERKIQSNLAFQKTILKRKKSERECLSTAYRCSGERGGRELEESKSELMMKVEAFRSHIKDSIGHD